jgi:hypothetical protein
VTSVKRRHIYDLQHLREPFLERHMFEAIKGSAIYNSVPGNNHSGYHTSAQHHLQLRNAVTVPIIHQAGYIFVSAINKYHDHHKLENLCTPNIEYFPVLHPCFNLALPSNIVTVSCKILVCHFTTTYKLRGWPIYSVSNNESKDAVNEKNWLCKKRSYILITPGFSWGNWVFGPTLQSEIFRTRIRNANPDFKPMESPTPLAVHIKPRTHDWYIFPALA